MSKIKKALLSWEDDIILMVFCALLTVLSIPFLNLRLREYAALIAVVLVFIVLNRYKEAKITQKIEWMMVVVTVLFCHFAALSCVIAWILIPWLLKFWVPVIMLLALGCTTIVAIALYQRKKEQHQKLVEKRRQLRELAEDLQQHVQMLSGCWQSAYALDLSSDHDGNYPEWLKDHLFQLRCQPGYQISIICGMIAEAYGESTPVNTMGENPEYGWFIEEIVLPQLLGVIEQCGPHKNNQERIQSLLRTINPKVVGRIAHKLWKDRDQVREITAEDPDDSTIYNLAMLHSTDDQPEDEPAP